MLEQPALIFCLTVDGFHSEKIIAYVIDRMGKVTILPTHEFVMKVRNDAGVPFQVHYMPCPTCRRKGVKGFTAFQVP